MLFTCCFSAWADSAVTIGGTVKRELFTQKTLPPTAKTVSDCELPEGWEWEEPDTALVPGQYVSANAQYTATQERYTVLVGRLAAVTPESQRYTRLSKDEITFISDGAPSALQSVWLDDQELTATTTTESITLENSFLDTLALGSHTLSLVYPVGTSKAELEIIRDTVKPTGKIESSGQSIVISASDNSGDVTVAYYLTNSKLSEADLKFLNSWSNCKPGTLISTGNKKNAYAKLTDPSGNVAYISLNEMAADKTAPLVVGLVSGKTYRTASGVRFTVEDSSEFTVEVNGNALSAQNDGSYLLSPGLSDATVTAVDKWKNTTTLTGITVEAGMDKPNTKDVNSNQNYQGNYSVPAAGEAVYSYRYDTVPGKAIVTFDDTKYTVTVNNQPAASPLTVNTGVAYPIFTKGVDGASNSDNAYFVIPTLSTASISAYASPEGSGTIRAGDGAAADHLKVTLYSGQSVTLYAAAKTGYRFAGWVDTRTGRTLSQSPNQSFEAVGDLEVTAEFVSDDAYTITEPTRPKNPPVYNGAPITFMEVPAHTALSGTLTAVNAGKYSFTLTPEQDYRWDDGTTEPKTYTWEIAKASTECPKVRYDAEDRLLSGLNPEAVYEAKCGVGGEVMVIRGADAFSPVDGEGNTLSGTWYLRQVQDENHLPSPWAVVTVDYPTLKISNTGVTELTENSARLNLLLSTLEGVEGVRLEYRRKGTENWTPLPQNAAVNLSVPLTGLQPETTYEYRLSTAAVTSNVWSFKTSPHQVIPSNIIAVVQNDCTESKVVTVTVEEKGTVLAAQEVTVMPEDRTSTDPFIIPVAGVYNIVLRTADGLYTETRSLVVEEDDEKTVSFSVTPGSFSSEVLVEDGVPSVAVDGLIQVVSDEELSEVQNNSKNVSLTLSIAPADLETTEGGDELSAIMKDDAEVMEVMEISLAKTTTTIDKGVVVAEETEDIGKVNTSVLEIVFSNTYDTTDISIFRYHNNAAEALRQVTESESGGADGTFFVSGQYIHLYASGYSTYAIVKNTSEDDPPHGDDPDPKPDPKPDPEPSPEPNPPQKPSGNGQGGSQPNETRYFHITAIAHEGGAITEAGVSTVAEYGNKTYTILPDTNRTIRYVLVDGVNVGAVSSYTFNNVRENHTIEVFFLGGSKRVSPQTSY